MSNAETIWTLIAIQAPLYAILGYGVKLLTDLRVDLARIEQKLDDHINDDRAHVHE